MPPRTLRPEDIVHFANTEHLLERMQRFVDERDLRVLRSASPPELLISDRDGSVGQLAPPAVKPRTVGCKAAVERTEIRSFDPRFGLTPASQIRGFAEAEAVARMALAMCDELERHECPDGEGLRMRIGIHCGPVVAGVFGKRKYSYDVWGDTVNPASRMESNGVAGRIHVGDEARALLPPGFMLDERGMIEVNGKGPMPTWSLDRKRAPLPSGA